MTNVNFPRRSLPQTIDRLGSSPERPVSQGSATREIARETDPHQGGHERALPKVARHVEREMFPRMSAAVLAATVFVAVDQVPNWNVAPSCRVAVSKTSPVGDMEVCMSNEQAARDQLAKEWEQFTPADKAHCLRLATLGGEPSYTDLLTCLELERDARALREKGGGTAGQ